MRLAGALSSQPRRRQPDFDAPSLRYGTINARALRY